MKKCHHFPRLLFTHALLWIYCTPYKTRNEMWHFLYPHHVWPAFELKWKIRHNIPFTSSLNFLMSSVSLWWVLMTSALPLATMEALSMRSGLRVPWARKTSSGFRFISPITSLAIYRYEGEGSEKWGKVSVNRIPILFEIAVFTVLTNYSLLETRQVGTFTLTHTCHFKKRKSDLIPSFFHFLCCNKHHNSLKPQIIHYLVEATQLFFLLK